MSDYVTLDDELEELRNRAAAWNVTEEKGGPGSGFEGHAGRPGKRGGSAPRESRASFDRAHWESIEDMGARREEWGKMSVAERDEMADAGNSIKERQWHVLEFAGARPSFDGNIQGAISKRALKMKELVPPQSLTKITKTVEELDATLEELDVAPEVRHELAMEALDSLAVQDNEALGRTLGDHGIHHIRGNIETANAILEAKDGEVDPADKAEVYLGCIFHDAGYLTVPSHVFIDEGHTRWSQEHYDKNLKPLVSEALGERTAGNMSHLIRTHDSTDLDWEGDPVSSAVRVADNAALFAKEKLPPVFRYVPGTMKVLTDLGSKKISVDEARSQISKLVEATDYAPAVKGELKRASRDVLGVTPKFTLGMMGGVLDGVSWHVDHPVLRLRKSKAVGAINKVLDVGQRQFAKFAEAYGYDPGKFMKDLKFSFSDKGKVLLESEIVEGIMKGHLRLKEKSMKGTIHLKGGKGSGDFGHRGIPGHQGGSLPGSGGGGYSLDREGGKRLMTDIKDKLAAAGLQRTSKWAGGEISGLISSGSIGSTGFSVADTGDGLRFNVVISGKNAGVRYSNYERMETRQHGNGESYNERVQLHKPDNAEKLTPKIKSVFESMGFKVKSARNTGWSEMWDDDLDYTVMTDYGPTKK